MNTRTHTRTHAQTAAPSRQATRMLSGFTLVELLTVVSIILILAALLFPAINKLIRQAGRQKAAAQALSIANACSTFHLTYGYWPGQTAATAADQSDPSADHAKVIAALNDNDRGLHLLEIKDAWVKGDEFIDPWEHPIVIIMDENSTGNIELDVSRGSLTLQTNLQNETIAVMSWGPRPEREAERVYSWR